MQRLTFPFKTMEHLGIFETPQGLADYLVKNSLDDYFNKIKSDFLKSIQESNEEKTRKAITIFLSFKACDPMMGSGAFIKALLSYLLELKNWFYEKSRGLDENSVLLKNELDILSLSEQNFLEYLLTHSVYGVELDKTMMNNWKTFVKEIIPNNTKIIDLNFKLGNSLLDPASTIFYDKLATKNQEHISELIHLRQIFADGNITESQIKSMKELQKKIISKIKLSFANKIEEKIMKNYFSWYFEFPEIFFNKDGKLRQNLGFDLIIGNPPWKTLRPDDREFFENYLPEFSSMKRTQRDCKKNELMREPKIVSKYKSYLDSIKLYGEYFTKSGIYKFQGTRSLNFYKLSLERFYQLVKNGGIVGAITPLGIATDLGAGKLRKILLQNCDILFIIGFDPKSKFFENADFSPALLAFKKGGRTKNFTFANGFVSQKDVKLEQLPKIDVNLIEKTSPTSLSFPSIKFEIDVSILEKMYTFPILDFTVDDGWNVEFSRELDETNDRHLFRNKKTKIPLIKGANIGPFKIKKPPFIWIDEKKFLEVSKDYKFSRVAWRDVARPNLKNRLIATLIPSNYALGNSLNYIKSNIPEILKYFLLAFLNSSIAEYRIKQLTSNSHINQFIIKQLPIPRLPLNNLAVIQIAKLSKELSESKLNIDDSSRHVKKIDKLFSKIYNFSFEEIQHIEKTVGYENL